MNGHSVNLNGLTIKLYLSSFPILFKINLNLADHLIFLLPQIIEFFCQVTSNNILLFCQLSPYIFLFIVHFFFKLNHFLVYFFNFKVKHLLLLLQLLSLLLISFKFIFLFIFKLLLQYENLFVKILFSLSGCLVFFVNNLTLLYNKRLKILSLPLRIIELHCD